MASKSRTSRSHRGPWYHWRARICATGMQSQAQMLHSNEYIDDPSCNPYLLTTAATAHLRCVSAVNRLKSKHHPIRTLHLDLSRAPYALYCVNYIDLVPSTTHEAPAVPTPLLLLAPVEEELRSEITPCQIHRAKSTAAQFALN